MAQIIELDLRKLLPRTIKSGETICIEYEAEIDTQTWQASVRKCRVASRPAAGGPHRSSQTGRRHTADTDPGTYRLGQSAKGVVPPSRPSDIRPASDQGDSSGPRRSGARNGCSCDGGPPTIGRDAEEMEEA